MLKKLPLRTALFLTAIFLLVGFGSSLNNLIDRQLYDLMMNKQHNLGYGSEGLHPALRLLAYREGRDLGDRVWSKTKTEEMTEFLLANGASAVVFHPGPHQEFRPAEDSPALTSEIGNGLEPIIDPDGVCRRVALGRQEVKDGSPVWTPCTALKILAKLERVSEDQIEFQDGVVVVGQRKILTDENYSLPVRFRVSQDEVRAEHLSDTTGDTGLDYLAPLSLRDFYQKKEAKTFLCPGGIFLVGTGFKAAESTLETPLGPLQNYKAQACLLETLLGNWELHILSGLELWGLSLGLVLVTYSVYVRLPVLGIFTAWGIGQFCWFQIALQAFAWRVFLPYSPFLLSSTLLAVYVGYNKLHQAREGLKRFGGQGALQAASRGDESIFEDVREKTATIVFTNVPAFLKKLERYGSPDDFFEKRQAYAQLLSNVFRSHGGVVLDFQGDFQMLGFNVELKTDDPDHAKNAVLACQEFLVKVRELGDSWSSGGVVKLGAVACGACTGLVACGHVGAHRSEGGRIAQAAIGDTSNTAARLLGAALKQKRPIILAKTTGDAMLGQIPVEALEPVALKGKAEPVPICQPWMNEVGLG